MLLQNVPADALDGAINVSATLFMRHTIEHNGLIPGNWPLFVDGVELDAGDYKLEFLIQYPDAVGIESMPFQVLGWMTKTASPGARLEQALASRGTAATPIGGRQALTLRNGAVVLLTPQPNALVCETSDPSFLGASGMTTAQAFYNAMENANPNLSYANFSLTTNWCALLADALTLASVANTRLAMIFKLTPWSTYSNGAFGPPMYSVCGLADYGCNAPGGGGYIARRALRERVLVSDFAADAMAVGRWIHPGYPSLNVDVDVVLPPTDPVPTYDESESLISGEVRLR